MSIPKQTDSAAISAATPEPEIKSVWKTGHPIVDQIGEIHFEGRLIPHAWRRHPLLRNDAGKTSGCVLDLLADIVYFHRPSQKFDTASGRLLYHYKKFETDRYRIDYAAWCEANGYSDDQVRRAVAFLRSKGIIMVEVEDYTPPSGRVIVSAVFITPSVGAIIALNDPDFMPPPELLFAQKSAVRRSRHDAAASARTLAPATQEVVFETNNKPEPKHETTHSAKMQTPTLQKRRVPLRKNAET